MKKSTETNAATEQKFNKQEIIYSAIVEKELLHNGMVQREMLRTLKDLNKTMSELTAVVRSVEQHQFLSLHKRKWKIVVYNLSMGMLFAIGTVLGLMLLSWSTYLFFRESPQIQNLINDQLKLRHFDLGELKQQAETSGPLINLQEAKLPEIKAPATQVWTDTDTKTGTGKTFKSMKEIENGR